MSSKYCFSKNSVEENHCRVSGSEFVWATSIGAIDYRCDDGKKELLSWGDILVSLRS